MKTHLAIVAGLIAAVGVGPARAQQGLATSSTIGGHNTIQQAPSGGAARQPSGGDASAGNAVQPTDEERRTEKRNDAATQICKGC